MPLAEIRNGRVEIKSEFREREMIKLIPGSKWDTQAQTWWCPLSWATCMQLRGVFKENLQVGQDLSAWAKNERVTRVDPCTSLRVADDSLDVNDDRLRPFQRAGVKFLSTAKRALCADSMGLGKTIQAIIALENIDEAFPALVVCPNSMKFVWRDEYEKWAPHRSVVVITGGKAARVKQITALRDGKFDVGVINWEGLRGHTRLEGYGSMRLDESDKVPKELNEIEFKTIIADEAHKAKDPKAKQTRALWWLGKSADNRFALTGTPVANTPEDAWSIMHFVSPEEFPTKTKYIDRYCVPPESMVWMADGTFEEIGQIQIGNNVMGFSKQPITEKGKHPHYAATKVLAVNRRIADLVRVTVASGESFVCTPDHRWLVGWYRTEYGSQRRPVFDEASLGVCLRKVVEVPEPLQDELQETASWLGGIYDGEGSCNAISQSPVVNSDVFNEIEKALVALKIPFTTNKGGFRIVNGRSGYAKFLHYCRPRKRFLQSELKRDRSFSRIWHGTLSDMSKARSNDMIVKIEPIEAGEVVSLTTESQTYIVHGYASHNCLQSWNMFGGMEIIGIKSETKDELFSIMDPRFIRRTKEMVMPQLPEKTYVTRTVELAPKQRKAYDQLRTQMLAELDSGILVATNPLTKMVRLIQFAAAYGEIDESNNLLLAEPSCKVDALLEIVEELGEQRALVFAESRQLVEMAYKHLVRNKPHGAGIAATMITGKTPVTERPVIVDDFNKGKYQVLLMTLGAGGEGLSFPGCSIAVFLQRSFSSVKNSQAEDRIHGIGRGDEKISSTIIDVLSLDTIEEKVHQVRIEKADKLEEIVRDEETLRVWLAK